MENLPILKISKFLGACTRFLQSFGPLSMKTCQVLLLLIAIQKDWQIRFFDASQQIFCRDSVIFVETAF